MWGKKTVSVVFPTYKEKNSVRRAIEEFDFRGFVDEIIVVDNNAETGTAQEVGKTRARLVKETKQGYGHAIRRGIETAKSDLLIIAEPDGSFSGKDVVKLLSYSDDFDMVFGSRTHRPFYQKNSDMTLLKRLGDVMLSKLANLLFLRYPITDLGCTLRLTSKKAWRQIAGECQSSDGLLATEWVLVAMKNDVKYVEIPINFRARVGKSVVSGTLYKKMVWGIRKFVCIWRVWFSKLLDQKLYS